MSNESSASETTPLRRPESQLSEVSNVQISDTPYETAINSETTIINAPTIFNLNDQTTPIANRPIGGNIINNNIRNSSSGRNNNNNNYSSNLGNNFRNFNNRNQNFTNSSSNIINQQNIENPKVTKMDTNKRILCRVGLDVLIFLCVGFSILFFYLWGNAYKRGFFCDDESLKHPFKDSTVKTWMLYIIGLVIPVGVILSTEFYIFKRNKRLSNGNGASRRYVFMDYTIPDWMVECYKKIGVFGFGAAVSQLTTDIAKYTIGRLRPHFFAVCQPILKDGTTCSDAVNIGKYIIDFTCQGVNSTPQMLKEVRLSFPSGHSSFTFYTMLYFALYLQSRMTWRGSKLLRHFLQFMFIMIAWYTALTRVSDYKHHWSDVLGGSTLGAIIAIVMACFVSDLFDNKPSKSFNLPRTNQDATIIVNGQR